MENKMFVHELTLPEKDEFSKKFNYVSWLFEKFQEAEIEENVKDSDFYFDEYYRAKLCLEQGYPISYLNEYNDGKL